MFGEGLSSQSQYQFAKRSNGASVIVPHIITPLSNERVTVFGDINTRLMTPEDSCHNLILRVLGTVSMS